MDLHVAQLLTIIAAGCLMAFTERVRLQRLLARLRRWWHALPSVPTLPAMPGMPATPGSATTLVTAHGLATRSWAFPLNEQPDRAPHVLLVGPSGAGKTTFTRALIAMRQGQVVVLTPKPDDDWGTLPAITIDDDGSFTSIARAIDLLNHEVRRRLVAGKQRLPIGEPLTIICDDFPVLVSEVGKPAAGLFKLVGRLGRSLRVRLIVLSQSDRVKSLGLSGEGDAAENYLRVDLARGHRATLEYEHYTFPLDTQEVPALAQRPNPMLHGWVFNLSTVSPESPGYEVAHSAPAADNERNGAVTASEQAVSASLPVPVTAQEAAQIAYLLGSLPPSEVVKRLDGYSPRRYGELKAKVDAVRQLLAPSQHPPTA